MKTLIRLLGVAVALVLPAAVHAETPFTYASGKLLLTGGVNTVEGTAGGGLTPWAVIGSYGEKGQFGANVYATDVNTTDYDIRSYGGLVGLDDRLEISWSHQDFDTEAVGAALGLGHGYTIGQDVLGVKVKILGDAVLEQDSWLPQVAAGIQFKKNQNGALVKALGARDDEGTDYYVSATKLFLAKGLLVNGTVRATKANQFGILGFGGIDDDYHYQFEGSVAYLLTRKIAIGAEIRTKPNNLAVAKEDAAFDVFVAYAPVKHISLTLAYADLGNIVTRRQTGLYASLQVGF
ncbi:hypothetical protein ABAC460_02030 [Asticcacaulis sp. AC460]|uniref:DUF3034 family protein n=1 Tax=Asticcacaulis sp. AC460 TaxID=1282360 RepID=UPI0003C3D825|nr:DUF3034 family protein [Asticcacaulis sp. AC460]ESQ93056.1 hypothetical protein ABAC460_02030 [Asticcacaulis sp. AC460]